MMTGATAIARHEAPSDAAKLADEAHRAIEALGRMRLRTVLLTGDTRAVADAVARTLGIGEVEADLLPDEKLARIRRLKAQGRSVAMLGDGINDAPALTEADVGARWAPEQTSRASALDQHVEDFALGVDGAPQIDHPAIAFQIDLVEMPGGVRLRPAFTQVSRDHGSKMVHPAAHALIGHQDLALGKQILDVAETQGEPDIKPDRLLDDFGREAVAVIADLSHHQWLRLKITDGKPNGDVTMLEICYVLDLAT